MLPLITFALVALLVMMVPASAETLGKWSKGAPFPEPSQELVGASVGGKFYVFGGLGPGWTPQGLVHELASRERRHTIGGNNRDAGRDGLSRYL